jgi:putative spermidine/putrescine transport system permease protein
VAPFLLFTALFLILPTLYIVLGAFRTTEGSFTLEHVLGLNTPSIRNAYWVSIRISFWSALLGCLIGLGMSAAVIHGGLPKVFRSPLMTFSGVASNLPACRSPSPS